MVKGVKGNLIFLGLSEENIRRLKLGDPIKFNMKQLGLPVDYDILIFYGETEDKMAQMISDGVGPRTTLMKSIRLKK
jgi:hypothetical protein